MRPERADERQLQVCCRQASGRPLAYLREWTAVVSRDRFGRLGAECDRLDAPKNEAGRNRPSRGLHGLSSRPCQATPHARLCHRKEPVEVGDLQHLQHGALGSFERDRFSQLLGAMTGQEQHA